MNTMEPIHFLRLFVDPSWRRTGLHAPFLYPFWGNPNTEASLFAKEMFDACSFDTSMYTITDDITKADVVFAPYRHIWLLQHDPKLLEECARTAQEAKLPLFIDGMGDIEKPINIQNSYVLRIGGYRFLPEKNRIQVPPAADDLLERVCGGKFEPREKREEKPVIGFAGWAELSLEQRLRTIAKELTIRLRAIVDDRYKACEKGVLWRERALDILGRSDKVVLNLRKRSSFSGNVKTASDDMRRLRAELVETVLTSDYALDVRGDANDATRLFEILSLGRIPVILDTERNFPFSDVVDYDSFSLRVDFRDIHKLPDIVAEFHKNISPERFLEMQQNARAAFVAHFRIDAQMKHILRQINYLRTKEKEPAEASS